MSPNESKRSETGAGLASFPSLEHFLGMAYDLPRMAEHINREMLSSRQVIAALVPQRAHLTKDDRLIVAYTAHVHEPSSPAVQLPVYFHYGGLSRTSSLKQFRDLEVEDNSGLFPRPRRSFSRVSKTEFITIFPHDPQFRYLGKLLKPGNLLAFWNTEFVKDKPAAAIQARHLAYRPERRAVFEITSISSSGELTRRVVKFCRRSDAERIWNMTPGVREALAPDSSYVLPIACSPSGNALLFPFCEGQSLHELMEKHRDVGEEISRTAKLLTHLHKASDPSSFEMRTFTPEDELCILHRWRRFFKSGEAAIYGNIAKYVRVLEEHKPPPVVTALLHRDFYPKQIIANPWSRSVRLIDIDTLVMGDPMLDVGNFIAHLDAEEIIHPTAVSYYSRLRETFIDSYRGSIDEKALAWYELSSLVRLTCLIATSWKASASIDEFLRRCRALTKRLA